MTPAELRAICDSLNDERGTGGQSKLARLLGWDYSPLWRKLNGKRRLTQSDVMAITCLVDSRAIVRGFAADVIACYEKT